jgi:N-acetylneuraminic acid mutarotase
MTMITLVSLATWLRGEVQKRRLPARRRHRKPVLEVLEDRNLLAFWTTVSPMPTARAFLAGTRGADAFIYAIGGTNDGSTALNTVEAYNTNSGIWSTRAPMNIARMNLAAASNFDARTYAFGGDGGEGGEVAAFSSVECYSPFSNTWTLVAPMHTARTELAGVRGADGRIYAIGGRDAGFNTLNTVEAYNTRMDVWTFVAPMHTPRRLAAAALAPDGRIYVFGGVDQSFNVLNTVECYSPFSNTWTFVASMPTARFSLAAAPGPNGSLLALGGQDQFGNVLNTVESYKPNTNLWSTVVSMPTARFGLAAALGADSGVYAFGGEDSTFTIIATTESLRSISGFAGAAPGGKPAFPAAIEPTSGPENVALPVSPDLQASNPGVVQRTRSGDNALHKGTDLVFAAGADRLSADLADTLFARGTG